MGVELNPFGDETTAEPDLSHDLRRLESCIVSNIYMLLSPLTQAVQYWAFLAQAYKGLAMKGYQLFGPHA